MKPHKRLWIDLLEQLAAFTLLAALIILLQRDNWLLLGAMLAEMLVVLWLWHEPSDVAFVLVIGMLGLLAEIIFVHFGVWRYTNPTLLGVPIWFPLAFGTAGLIGGRLVRTVTGMWEVLFKKRTLPGSLS